MMHFPTFLLIIILSSSSFLCNTSAEVLNKGDRGDAVTMDTVSSTNTKDLIREATGWERPVYGTQTWYPPSGNNKGYARTSYGGYQTQGSQGGYPTYGGNYGSYQGNYYQGGGGGGGGYGSQIRGGGYVGNRGSYGNNKGWPTSGSGWSGNYGRPGPGGSYGNYKGGSTGNRGWYGGGQSGYNDGWYGGNQVRPSSGGYVWPSRGGYRGDGGSYGSSYGGGSWSSGSYGPSYGGYGNQGLNTGIGNQIYGSGYTGSYGNQKGWGSASYGNLNTIPNQGNYWGSSSWSGQGYQGNYKGSPRINTWPNSRQGYPNSKGWY